jgi:prophage DNA circulation protein
MEKMTFKKFTWPRNPEVYNQSWEREPVYEKNEADEMAFTGMGPKKLTITGSGCFSGDTAYADFKKLAALMEEATTGSLVHPVWGTMTAYLTGLELTQEPRENYVAYRFTFREADSQGAIPK